MGGGDFRPPPTAPRRGWSRKIASLTHARFFFSLTSSCPQVPRIFVHPHATIRHYTSFPPGSAFWVRNMKVEMWPLLPSKNVKMGLSWRSMENFSRRNPGTVSRIQFKLGIGVDHISGISWYDSKIKRSRPQGHVTYLNKKCNNSVLGSPINFILGD